MERVICIIIGYICGLFQTGFFYGKLHHIDIRDHGSGNSGTTNAMRTLGKKAGIITFLGDCLKTVLAFFIVKWIFGETQKDMIPLLGMYAGLGTILGHNFPFYMNFSGGKGIAATAGLLLAFNFPMMILGVVTFVITVAFTKYVSLGSLLLVSGFFIELVLFGQWGKIPIQPPQLYELYGVGLFIMLLAFYRHRENIKRLLNGTERKLGEKAK